MGERTLALVGATGDVGTGILRATVRRGWSVVAVSRTPSRLAALRAEHGSAVRTLVSDIGDEAGGVRLAAQLGPVDAVVVSVHVGCPLRPVLDWPADELNALVAGNVGAHLVAARHLMPLVRDGGDFLGIGGGMADLVIPRYVPLAVAQAAQRQLYRGLIREARKEPRVRIRELLVAAMVNGPSTRQQARPDWITEDEIGERVAELLAEPGADTGAELDPGRSIQTLVSPRATR
ncbi:SDR family oxidoreductase [Streptomyces sp. NPDC090075]|uniref:SDR family oxidoreductase n=1 Tax=Streptomyces sp. NPDC090075 TaxID=3365937 RepID=UPI00381DBE5D